MYSLRKQFRGRLVFDFPTPPNSLQRLNNFVVVALSGATGIPEDDIAVEKSECKQDSRKTTVFIMISADSELDGWERVSKVRKAVADKGSSLNTVGHMKKVFAGATLQVFEPGSPEVSKVSDKKAQVRYREDAPLNAGFIPRAPLTSIPVVSSTVIDATERVKSPKHRLPPDAAHIPFDVLVIPPGAKSPPESPKREMHFHLPKPTAEVDEEEDEVSKLELLDMKRLVSIINSPKPVIPESLMSLFHKLKHRPEQSM